MTRLWEMLERPHEREVGEQLRRGRHGTYRQAADGLIVRCAAAEPAQDTEELHRALLVLAVRDALAQGQRPGPPQTAAAELHDSADRTTVFTARAEGNAGRTCL